MDESSKKEKILVSLPSDTAEYLRVFVAKSRRKQSEVVDQAIRQMIGDTSITSTLARKRSVAS